MMYTMASQMKTVEAQLSAAQMNANMMDNLKGVNSIMTKVNASMNPQ